MSLPRDAEVPSRQNSPARSPFPPGPDISLEILLEVIAVVRDDSLEQTFSQICAGRGPLGIAATLAGIAGKLGYQLTWQREPTTEIAELRNQLLSTPRSPIDLRSESSQRTRATATERAEPSRNQPCPCGSGKKYKRCCAEK